MSNLAAFRRGWVTLSQDLGNIFGFYKTRHVFAIWQCKLYRATCSRFDTIPACDRQTDGQTDGRTDENAIASTALAMRALRRAVKSGDAQKKRTGREVRGVSPKNYTSRSARALSVINDCFQSVRGWLDGNELCLNPDRSEAMVNGTTADKGRNHKSAMSRSPPLLVLLQEHFEASV